MMRSLRLFLICWLLPGLLVSGCDSVLSGDERIADGTILLASDGAERDNFGSDVAISGDDAIVGATDNQSVYFYERQGTQWIETQIVGPGRSTANFGISVAIDGELAVVGGDGFMHIFQKQQEGWIEAAILNPAERGIGIFGRTVAIQGDLILVGAIDAEVNGIGSGAVFVFQQIDNEWQEVGRIEPPDPEDGDDFGRAIALHGDYAIIGAPGKRSVNESPGAAYIFNREEEGWAFSTKLRNSTNNTINVGGLSFFGFSVDISENFAVVGNFVFEAVSVYQRQGNSWLSMATLVPETDPDPSTIDTRSGFGADVAISESHILVGAFAWPVIESGSDEGGAFLYRREGSGWGEPLLLAADEPVSQDQFGARVALGDGAAMVAAPLSDEQGTNAGSVHVFDL